jgi:hypothetical protein
MSDVKKTLEIGKGRNGKVQARAATATTRRRHAAANRKPEIFSADRLSKQQ